MAEIKWKTKEEIEAEKNTPPEPNVRERLEAVEQALLEMVLGGNA